LNAPKPEQNQKSRNRKIFKLRRIGEENSRQQTATLEKAVKKLTKSLENKADVDQYQETLLNLMFLRCVSQFRDHGLNIPVEIQWQILRSKVSSPYFGETVINALEAVEDANSKLK